MIIVGDPSRVGERGVALVSTLAILTIVTVILVAYVSIVSSDRRSTQNYSRGIQADELAKGGLAQIVSQLRAEIVDTSDPTAVTNLTSTAVPASTNFPIYRPLKGVAAVPQRMAIPSLAGANLANIVKISVPGRPFYTNTATGRAGAGGTSFASTALTTSRSLNGRSISIARWNAPLLTVSTNQFPAPAWVVVGRDGPIALPSASSPPGASATALGRYAYVVYDVGGLLDANVAGYPAAAVGSAAGKGLLPWADLSQLANTISTTDVERLVAWRNQAHAGNYAANVTNEAAGGFMKVIPGDTAFLTRQELIKYAQTQGGSLTNALPYLTTFSRDLNGPVWGPSADAPLGAPYDYLKHQYDVTAVSRSVSTTYGTITTANTVYNNNVFLLGPRVQTLYTNNFGLVRKAGEPLVKYRFPLDKLALLEKARGPGTLTTQDVADIQRYFGLDYVLTGGNDPQGNPLASSGLYRHWSYPTASRSGNSAGRILTLNEVATLKRDPDFFELLQAGILSGSLGKPGRGDYATTSAPSYAASIPDPDVSIPFQMIKIGANIIDQWDADSCPTTITFNGWNFYGVEDLPYVSKVFFKFFSTAPQTAVSGLITPLFYCELWNPHQNATPNAASYPTQFRLAPTPYDTVLLGVVNGAERWWLYPSPTTTTAFSSLNNRGVMTFSASPSEYREPSLIYAGTPQIDPVYLQNVNPVTAGPGSDRAPARIVGLTFPTVSLPAVGTRDSTNVANWPPAAPYSVASPNIWQAQPHHSLVYTLQYQDPTGGTWHTYGTLFGMEPTTANNANYWPLYVIQNEDVSQGSTANACAYTKSDPRTARWAAASCNWTALSDMPKNAGNSLSPIVNSPSSYSGYNFISGNAPFGLSASGTTAFRFELWPMNTNTVVSPAPSPYYLDQDRVQRLGDAVYAAGASGVHSPYYPNDPTRPVVLNRPFASVAELGNVYRDIPWRSLDFFSPTSADAALLDLFTLSDGPVVAGHVNPNTAPSPVLQALLNGASLSPIGGGTLPNVAAVVAAFRNTATNNPFVSRSDIVGRFMTNAVLTGVSANKIKGEREVVLRALVESANTRTWNFLIDVIAQSGHYPPGAASLDGFSVDGERRYWLHIAIDRLTGEIVDQQLEAVNE